MGKIALHPHAFAINALGGPTIVARRLGLDVLSSVGKWPTRGIPAQYWLTLAEWAAERGIAGVTHAGLLEAKMAWKVRHRNAERRP